MLFRHSKEPQDKSYVDLGDLQNEKENMTNFLQSHLQITVYPVKDKLAVDSEKVSFFKLRHAVEKFVYHRGLNATHWVSTEGSTVKINRFNRHEKKEKHKKESPHQTLTQSWGL